MILCAQHACSMQSPLTTSAAFGGKLWWMPHYTESSNIGGF